MVHIPSEKEREKVEEEFNRKYRPQLTNEALSELYGRRVEHYDIRIVGVRDDCKTLFIRADIAFRDGKEARFWKHYVDWGTFTSMSKAIYKNPFTEKNEDDYLEVLSNKGFVPKYDWTHTFPVENGSRRISRIISMEYVDMNMVDFLTTYAEELMELKSKTSRSTAVSSKSRISELERIISTTFRLVINASAFNDNIFCSSEEGKSSSKLLTKIMRMEKEEYLVNLKNYMFATSGELFSDSFEKGSEWYGALGCKLESCLKMHVAKRLTDYPDMEAPRNLWLHPENVLISKGLDEKTLLEIDPRDINQMVKSQGIISGVFHPYSQIKITDQQMMIVPIAFSYSNLINFIPFSNLEFGLSEKTKTELFKHALFADRSFSRGEKLSLNLAPLTDELPMHMSQAEAATIFHLLLNTYTITMYYQENRIEKELFKELMDRRLSEFKNCQGHGEFGVFKIVYSALQHMFNRTLGIESREEWSNAPAAGKLR